MTKQEVKKYLLVRVKSKLHKVYVNDLKAIIMRKKPLNRPRVPPFHQNLKNIVETDTEASVCSE